MARRLVILLAILATAASQSPPACPLAERGVIRELYVDVLRDRAMECVFAYDFESEPFEVVARNRNKTESFVEQYARESSHASRPCDKYIDAVNAACLNSTEESYVEMFRNLFRLARYTASANNGSMLRLALTLLNKTDMSPINNNNNEIIKPCAPVIEELVSFILPEEDDCNIRCWEVRLYGRLSKVLKCMAKVVPQDADLESLYNLGLSMLEAMSCKDKYDVVIPCQLQDKLLEM